MKKKKYKIVETICPSCGGDGEAKGRGFDELLHPDILGKATHGTCKKCKGSGKIKQRIFK